MKTNILILTLALGASTCLLTAQENNPAPERQRPPGAEAGPGGEHHGPMLLPPPVAERLNVTAEQREQVVKLEEEIKGKMEKILTPDQLQQLKQLPPPMAQGGQGMPNRRMGGPGGPNGRMRGPGGAGGPDAPMGGPGMQGGMEGQRPMNPIILALDLNKDGVIDSVEIDKAVESLKKLDKNGDGKLTPDEVRPPRVEGMGGQGQRGMPGRPGGQGGQGLPQRPPPEQ